MHWIIDFNFKNKINLTDFYPVAFIDFISTKWITMEGRFQINQFFNLMVVENFDKSIVFIQEMGTYVIHLWDKLFPSWIAIKIDWKQC